MRLIGVLAAVLGGLAVVLGAFGAHALQGRLDEAALRTWHTAVEYQFWHALALLGLAGFALRTRVALVSAAALAGGTLLFSGSLYALALGGPRWLGMLTPIGGIGLILGWVFLAMAWGNSRRE